MYKLTKIENYESLRDIINRRKRAERDARLVITR